MSAMARKKERKNEISFVLNEPGTVGKSRILCFVNGRGIRVSKTISNTTRRESPACFSFQTHTHTHAHMHTTHHTQTNSHPRFTHTNVEFQHVPYHVSTRDPVNKLITTCFSRLICLLKDTKWFINTSALPDTAAVMWHNKTTDTFAVKF